MTLTTNQQQRANILSELLRKQTDLDSRAAMYAAKYYLGYI